VENQARDYKEHVADWRKQQPEESLQNFAFVHLTHAGNEEAEDGGDARTPNLRRRIRVRVRRRVMIVYLRLN
jgi:hypothetical protein